MAKPKKGVTPPQFKKNAKKKKGAKGKAKKPFNKAAFFAKKGKKSTKRKKK